MLGPLFSILKSANIKRPCDQFILLHLQRRHVLEWVRAMIAVALGVPLNSALPPIYVQEPTDDSWEQISESSPFARPLLPLYCPFIILFTPPIAPPPSLSALLLSPSSSHKLVIQMHNY